MHPRTDYAHWVQYLNSAFRIPNSAFIKFRIHFPPNGGKNRCPKVPIRSVFSPAMLSRLVLCCTFLPSPGVKRRGHDIHAQTRAPFCECGEKRNAVEHSRSIRCLYYNNRSLPCQASFPQDLPPCAHADPGRICGCPDPASCAAEFTRQSAARRFPQPPPAS